MNAIATQADNLNPFTAFGDAVSQKTIVGDILKFSKGEWLAGKDDEEVPVGTKFVAVMDEMLIGWVKWVEGKPAEHVMGKLAEGYKPPRRNELGDTDQADWETDDRGELRDPWQLTNYLIMASKEGRLFTFTTSSKGGMNALGALCKDYGRTMRAKPNDFPVVEVGVDSYRHPKKEYGKIFVPMFTIAGWTPKAPVLAALEGAQAEAEDKGEEGEGEAPPAETKNGRSPKAATADTRF